MKNLISEASLKRLQGGWVDDEAVAIAREELAKIGITLKHDKVIGAPFQFESSTGRVWKAGSSYPKLRLYYIAEFNGERKEFEAGEAGLNEALAFIGRSLPN